MLIDVEGRRDLLDLAALQSPYMTPLLSHMLSATGGSAAE